MSSSSPADLRSFRLLDPSPETLTEFCTRLRGILKVDAVQLVRPAEGGSWRRIAGAEPSAEIGQNLLETAAKVLQRDAVEADQSFDFAGRSVRLLGCRSKGGDWLLLWARLGNPEAVDLARQFLTMAVANLPGAGGESSPLAVLGRSEAGDDSGFGNWLAELSGGTHAFIARRTLFGWKLLASGPTTPNPGSALSRHLRRFFADPKSRHDREAISRLTGDPEVQPLDLGGGIVAVVSGPVHFQPNLAELQGAVRLLRLKGSVRTGARLPWKRIGVATLILLALLAVVPVPDRIRTPVVLEPSLRRVVAAPFDALVEEVAGERGDVVQAGDLLVELNGREIAERTAEVESRLASARLQNAADVEKANFAEAVVRALEAESLAHELEVLRQRQENLQVKSPIQGVIIGGELERARGAAVELGQPLIEVAPLTPLIAEFAVPDRDISYVTAGEKVEIRLDAFPNRTFRSLLDQIRPRSEVRDGQNVFIGEATLENPDQQLRPGMRGHGIIVAAAKPLGWILIRKPWGVVRSWLFR